MRKIETIAELKEIQLDIMKKIHCFCEINGIRYCLSHGSMLGAVRHGGFIPWDDDVDIFMPRKDYDKFCELFPSVARKYGLALANSNTKVFYGRVMSKVFDIRTKLEEPQFKDDIMGVNIDIWPLDGMPNTDEEREKHKRKCRSSSLKLIRSRSKFNAKWPIKSQILWLLANLKPSIIHIKHTDSLIRKYNYDAGEYVTCYVDPYCVKMKKSDFDKLIKVKFENTEFNIPEGYDGILTALYGDYMKLPPESKRKPHHIVDAYWI